MVPSSSFQLEHYKKRDWVNDYLISCSDPKQAFDNWMYRDIHFSKIVRNEAMKNQMNLIVVDGSKSIKENFDFIVEKFNL
jgi:hypothetical protein